MGKLTVTAQDRLAEIRARVEAATEGPWRAMPDRDGRLFAIDSDADYITLHNTIPADDATFIAHARTDVPALLAALDAVLDEHKETDALSDGSTWCLSCYDVHGDMMRYPCPTVRAIDTALGGGRGE